MLSTRSTPVSSGFSVLTGIGSSRSFPTQTTRRSATARTTSCTAPSIGGVTLAAPTAAVAPRRARPPPRRGGVAAAPPGGGFPPRAAPPPRRAAAPPPRAPRVERPRRTAPPPPRHKRRHRQPAVPHVQDDKVNLHIS